MAFDADSCAAVYVSLASLEEFYLHQGPSVYLYDARLRFVRMAESATCSCHLSHRESLIEQPPMLDKGSK